MNHFYRIERIDGFEPWSELRAKTRQGALAEAWRTSRQRLHIGFTIHVASCRRCAREFDYVDVFFPVASRGALAKRWIAHT